MACVSCGGVRDARIEADHVGSAACGACHVAEAKAWEDSSHAWAMKAATPGLLAGRFDGVVVPWGEGHSARPIRDGEASLVELRVDDTRPDPYPVRYVLGRRRIEQHLVELPGGRLQPLPLGFDLKRAAWFDIFRSDPRSPTDWGYWANRGMTANTHCLSCHTTGFERRYDMVTDAYNSRWAETGVGCEACHGAGGEHVRIQAGRSPVGDRYHAPPKRAVMDVCAPCHALRRELTTGARPRDAFLDFFEPLLLDGEEYYPDGQIHRESYEWASFLQSRMAQAGVTCTDCHDPHGGRVKAEGNALCLGCHEPQLGTAGHTHHPPESEGARCVACHMPVTVYMERDPRHDHAFSLPDPQLTVDLGVPNACGRCHRAEGPPWAAAQVLGWYGESPARESRRQLAAAFARARTGDATGVRALLPCLRDCEDDVRRASAARLLAPLAGQGDVRAALVDAARSERALVRAAAVWALAERPETSGTALAPLLAAARDDVRLVRLNAAWGLRRLRLDTLPEQGRSGVQRSWEEWQAAMATQAEHPESHHTLGVSHAERGDAEAAERSYRTALRLAPDSIPPRYNLAMLLAARGDTTHAEEEFRRVRQRAPDFAAAAYGLGLLYGETGRWREAVSALSDCLKIDPLYPGALTDLAQAYVQLGGGDTAIRVLEAASTYPGARTEALRALVAVNLALGDRTAARRWAEADSADDQTLAADPRVRELLEQ